MSSDKRIPSQTEIALNAFNRIQVAIKAAPLRDLAALVIKDLEFEPKTPLAPRILVDAGLIKPDFRSDGKFAPGRLEADEAIEELSNMAHLGDVTAIQHLVVLGCKIARILEGLVGNPETSEGGKIEKSNPLPADHIAQDTEISQFADDVDVLAGSDEKDLEASLGRLVTHNSTGRFSIGLDELCNLISPPAGLAPESSKPLPGNKRLVEMICESLVNRRLTNESRAAARRVAAESWGWPIEVSAIADKRIETIGQHLNFLALGSQIPAELDTQKGRGTGKVGTKRDFSIFIFEKLNTERTILRSPGHKKELLNHENGASAEADRQPPPPSPRLRITTWHIENYWKRKAALLPEFTQEAESQLKWHEAAMAYANSLCMGDFDNYRWPDVIMNRTGVNVTEAAHRGTKTVVSEVLKSGLLALAKKREP